MRFYCRRLEAIFVHVLLRASLLQSQQARQGGRRAALASVVCSPVASPFLRSHEKRFVIHDAPTDSNLLGYLEFDRRKKVVALVRACEPTYDKAPLEEAGIRVTEMPFQDGSPPPEHKNFATHFGSSASGNVAFDNHSTLQWKYNRVWLSTRSLGGAHASQFRLLVSTLAPRQQRIQRMRHESTAAFGGQRNRSPKREKEELKRRTKEKKEADRIAAQNMQQDGSLLVPSIQQRRGNGGTVAGAGARPLRAPSPPPLLAAIDDDLLEKAAEDYASFQRRGSAGGTESFASKRSSSASQAASTVAAQETPLSPGSRSML